MLKYREENGDRRGMSMNQKRDPIGVFDSGVGGISTLREMIRELPDERFIYFGEWRMLLTEPRIQKRLSPAYGLLWTV